MNVLILRCAKWFVVDIAVQKAKEDSENLEIEMLVQENAVDAAREKYPDVSIVSLSANYFDYNQFVKNICLEKRYDRVYVPTSGLYFYKYEEIYRILEKIDYIKAVYVNRNGEEIVECNSVLDRLKDKVSGHFLRIFSSVIRFWYCRIGYRKGI